MLSYPAIAVVLGILVLVGLALRNVKVRQLIPVTQANDSKG